MIIGTMKINHTQDNTVELDFETKTQGKATTLEMAHVQAIAQVLQHPDFQTLVRVMLLKHGMGFNSDKHQSNDKASEQSESPIQEIH
ncbi:hypothetical protein IHC87_06655 [Photobacterium damselae subsp. damselae]|uniref:hypothetical protein n=1 Tax=Photobacterium damselae TaxID=38293 RepID=UPI001F170478|nr:hypothetical protein [Photobacterium damselae]UJZ95020.1 hypothetical protein IHC87_06655 [Photobacterium damselae subsp. damselae]UJZ99001.1 hypothetical protein IHC88_06645 [Photobacterium damselae subsp. damselae]